MIGRAATAFAIGLATLCGAHAESILFSASGVSPDDPFWAAVRAGAAVEAAEAGAELTFDFPTAHPPDNASQVGAILEAIERGIDGLVIAPNASEDLSPVFKAANTAGVAVVFVGRPADDVNVPFVGTNDVAAARLAAEYICQNVPARGRVAVLGRTDEGETNGERVKTTVESLTDCGLVAGQFSSSAFDEVREDGRDGRECLCQRLAGRCRHRHR